MYMKSKIGRPKKKKSELKKQVTIRLTDEQKRILKRVGESVQKGIDILIEKIKGPLHLK